MNRNQILFNGFCMAILMSGNWISCFPAVIILSASAFAEDNEAAKNITTVNQLRFSKILIPVKDGGVAGVSPAEGVA
jgi:hypothetical protein